MGDKSSAFDDNISNQVSPIIVENYSEDEIERIINFQDKSAKIIITDKQSHRRVYNNRIINDLKKLYGYKCQICGMDFNDTYGIKLAEAHHIDYFSSSNNNDANNIIILCPNHHRIIHTSTPIFDRDKIAWIYKNGFEEKLIWNLHL
jgi:predicted restriction endonuclease